MKSLLLSTLLLISFTTFGQNRDKQISKINSAEKADKFIKENPQLEAKLLQISSLSDSDATSKMLLSKISNDTCTIDGYKYKIIESETTFAYRVTYIYLDGKELSMQAIDSLRNVIISKYKNGIPYSDLVKQYNMDHSSGELNWFSYNGGVIDEFVTAAANHKKGDIYTLNVDAAKWYYVVLKTHDDIQIKKMTVLKIKAGQ